MRVYVAQYSHSAPHSHGGNFSERLIYIHVYGRDADICQHSRKNVILYDMLSSSVKASIGGER